MRMVLVALLFFAQLAAAQELCRAIDGDTLRCGRERVRLIGVYAAEMSEAGGEAARARLERRLAAGAVTIERRGRDRYGRTLGVVYVDGVRVVQADVGAAGGRGLRVR